jgi:hypothetical protein
MHRLPLWLLFVQLLLSASTRLKREAEGGSARTAATPGNVEGISVASEAVSLVETSAMVAARLGRRLNWYCDLFGCAATTTTTTTPPPAPPAPPLTLPWSWIHEGNCTHMDFGHFDEKAWNQKETVAVSVVAFVIIVIMAYFYTPPGAKDESVKHDIPYMQMSEEEAGMCCWMPSLNIFQYLGLVAEFRRHRDDLQSQLEKLANDMGVTLGSLPQERKNKLTSELLKSVEEQQKDQKHRDSRALRALRLFVIDELQTDKFLYREYSQLVLTCFVLLFVLLAELCFFCYLIIRDWNAYYCSTIHYDFIFFRQTILGKALGLTPQLLIATVVILIIGKFRWTRSRPSDRHFQIPAYWGWTFFGDLVFVFSTLLAGLAANIAIWVAHDWESMAFLLFGLPAVYIIFASEATVGFIVDPAKFRDWANDTYLLLAACPVNIQDLANMQASRDEEIPQISLNESGELLRIESKEPCDTRVRQDKDDKDEKIKVIYQRCKHEKVTLPPQYEDCTWRCYKCVTVVLCVISMVPSISVVARTITVWLW